MLLLLAYADLVGYAVTGSDLLCGMPLFVTEIRARQALAVSVLLTAAAAATTAARSPGAAGAARLGCGRTRCRAARTGDAAGTANHAVAIDTRL